MKSEVGAENDSELITGGTGVCCRSCLTSVNLEHLDKEVEKSEKFYRKIFIDNEF